MSLPHTLNLSSIENARELGGYTNIHGQTVKSGLLLRTARLTDISAKDKQILCDTYHLYAIIDLRSAKERDEFPEPALPNVKGVWLDIMAEKESSPAIMPKMTGDIVQDMRALSKAFEDPFDYYVSIIKGEHACKCYQEFFKVILAADDDQAILWHCMAGKDRTGIGAALLLGVLDVDDETILYDYLLTNTFRQDKLSEIEKEIYAKGGDKDIVDIATMMFGVVENNMRRMIEYCHETSGSIANFVKEKVGLSQAEIDKLKTRYLI